VTGEAAYQRVLTRLCELSERQGELSTCMHIAVMDAFNTLTELGQPLVLDSILTAALPIHALWADTIASIDEAAQARVNLPQYLRLVEAGALLAGAVIQP
jgi:hypothetical protein